MWLRSPLLRLMPLGLMRLLKNQTGPQGLVVKGWFHRGPWVSSTEGWHGVLVKCSGRDVGAVSELPARTALWVPLKQGRYTVEFVGLGRGGARYIVATRVLDVAQGEVWYMAFLPPAPNQVRRRANLRSKWRCQRLSQEDIDYLRPWWFPMYARLPDSNYEHYETKGRKEE